MGCLKENSPFGFLYALSDFALACQETCKDLFARDNTLTKCLGTCLRDYLRAFTGGSTYHRVRSNWFSVPELNLVYSLLHINDTL